MTKACDCHIHVFDHRFPMAPGDTRHVPDASVADYRHMQGALGTSRVVVVQPSTYGTDNSCTLAAIAELGSAARAVAVVDTSVSDAELTRLDAHHVRGIRFNLARPGATTIDMLRPLAHRVAPLGWHVQLHATADQIVAFEVALRDLPVEVVFDHMGRIPPAEGTRHRAFGIVTSLARDGRAWIKLSGPYLFASAWPSFDEADALVRAYVGTVADRLVWGSDWPNPSASPPVSASQINGWRGRWLPDASTRRRILVDNPALLYGFAETD